MAATKSVLIYGGRGALGSTLVNFFKDKGFKVTSIDFVPNEVADENILLNGELSFEQQAETVKSAIPAETKLDAILCVAGGWAGKCDNLEDLKRLK